MKKPLQIFLAVTCLNFNLLAHVSAQTSTLAQTGTQATSVTAAQYVDFLNSAAVSDPNHLYDDAMSSDSDAACIVRAGVPGRWHYEVIAGRENFPVTYVNKAGEENYYTKTGDIIFDDNKNSDASLRSNLSSFQIDSSSTLTLTLAAASISNATSSNSYFEEAAGVAGFIGLLACPELMMRAGGAGRDTYEQSEMDGSDNESDAISIHSCASSKSAVSARTTASMGRRNQYNLALVDFITAALEHPTADRLVIDEGDTEAIMPSKSSLNVTKNIRENKTIALAFKDVLRTEYSRDLAERLIPGQRSELMDSFSLSSANIFKYINKVERRITENSIIGLKESDLDVLSSHVTRKTIIVGETQEFYGKHQAALEGRNIDKTFLGKAAHAIDKASIAVGEVKVKIGIPGVAHVNVPLSVPLKVASLSADAANRAIEKGPMKLAKKIAEAAKSDLELVQKRIVALERKEAKKQPAKQLKPAKGVRFTDPNEEALEFLPQAEAVAVGVSEQPTRARKVKPNHQTLWEEALSLESAAEAAGFRASKSETAANVETYIEACRSAKKAWTTAAEAKELAASQISREIDKNQLMADTTTAEEKADDWGSALKTARKKYNATASMAPVSRVDVDSEIGAPAKAKAAVNVKVESDTKKRSDVMATAITQEAIRPVAQVKSSEAVQATSQVPSWSFDDPFAGLDYMGSQSPKKIEAHAFAMTISAPQQPAEEVAAPNFLEDPFASFNNLKISGDPFTGFNADPFGAFHADPFVSQQSVARPSTQVKSNEEAKPAFDPFAAFNVPKAAENPPASLNVKPAAAPQPAIVMERQFTPAQMQAHQATLAEIAELKSYADYYKIKATETKAAGTPEKINESINWHLVAKTKLFAAEQLEKAIEIESLGLLAEACAWQEAAVENQLASEYFKNAIEARAIGTVKEGDSWHNAAVGKLRAAKQLEQAIDAEAINKPAEALAWRQAAKQNQLASEYSKKAVEAYVQKASNATAYAIGGVQKLVFANQLEKLIIAESAGKLLEAALWREVVTQNQLASEYSKKGTETNTPKKIKESLSWYDAAGGKRLASEQLEKAIGADDAGNSLVASAWRNAATQNQLASEDFIKAAQQHAAGDSFRLISNGSGSWWDKEGHDKLKAAKRLAEQAEALSRK